jgi:hypothetical protein
MLTAEDEGARERENRGRGGWRWGVGEGEREKRGRGRWGVKRETKRERKCGERVRENIDYEMWERERKCVRESEIEKEFSKRKSDVAIFEKAKNQSLSFTY